jgi:hypothetical protein
MATVYEAVHMASDRVVALKLLRVLDEPGARNQITQLFEREFMTLAQVSHPRIVAAYDFGIDAEHGPFYAMELLDGGDLQQRAPVPYRQACSLARDICAALAFLHSRRLVYRDLSPRNVRCTASGAAKLIDFGALAPMGSPLEIVGTPPFVAPEVLQHQPLDERTDLFSLGATLYYALTGQHAYPARSLPQLWELWRTLPAPPSSCVPDLPANLDHLVMQLIQLDPVQRPTNAAEVMQRLEAVAGLAPDEELVQHAYMVAPALVGRDKELRGAQTALSNATNGYASSTLLVGAQGSGRSRFLDECALRAKVQGAIALQAAPLEAEDSDYALLRTLATALLLAAPEIAAEAAGPELSALGHVIPELSARWPQRDLSSLGPHERHKRVQAAACAWFAAIARQQPMCIVVDDAKRADVPSLALLAQLLRDHPSARLHLLWSVASEERAAADWPTALLLLERSSTLLELSPLKSAEIEELLSSIFGKVPNLAQLASYVEHTALGNPRDSLRLLEHLVRERIVTHQRGAWTLPARLQASELPSDMLDAFAQRIAKLNPSARQLAVAFAAEPRQRFSLDECRLLVDPAQQSNLLTDLLQNLEAGVIVSASAGYRLAQRGFAGMLSAAVASNESATQRRRLAGVFEARGDGLRRAKHLLAAGDSAQGIDTLIRSSIESEKRTDGDLRAFFEEMRALPGDWLRLYQAAIRACEELGRPARDVEVLLSRLVGFVSMANTSGGVDGFLVLKSRLDRLVREVGLDLYAALPAQLEGPARIHTALAQAKQRFDDTPAEQRVFEPGGAITPLTTTVLAGLGMLSVTNDVHAHRQLPSLAPLVPLAPALWIAQQTLEGVGARIEGRSEVAAKIYADVMERLERPDRAGMDVSAARSTLLRVSLSVGALHACMGRAAAQELAARVCSDADYETQGLMLRHLCELWQGKLGEAANTKQLVEQRAAFSRTRNIFEGQHLLGELIACVLLEDLTGLRHASEAAKRNAALHANWIPVVDYAQAEHERVRGDTQAALQLVERALTAMRGPREHQLWANAAASHVRLLLDVGRRDEATERGRDYVQSAEKHGLGYLTNYIRIALSQALCALEPASAIALSDQVIESFRALGSTGLNLVFALENRARIALEVEGPEAFEHHAALSSSESDGLSKRLRRTQLSGRMERSGDNAPGAANALASELLSLLQSSTELGESLPRVITMLTRRTAARGGIIYARKANTLQRVASGGQVPHPSQVDEWARVYFEGQLFAQDASTSVLDQVNEAAPSVYGIPAGMYLPTLLGHQGPDGLHYTGMLVLVMPMSADLSWLTVIVDPLSKSVSTVFEQAAKQAGE